MLTSFFQAPSGNSRQAQRRHPGALLLAIVLHILVFLLLLWQRALPIPVKMERQLNGFMLPAAKEDSGQEKTDATAHHSKAAKGTTDASNTTKPPPPVPPREVPEVPPSKNPLPFIEMSSSDFASSNIAGLPTGTKAGTQAQGDSKAAYGPSAGPGGSTLYSADWYRRPTHVELSTYVPSNAPPTGWGAIACRTVERYHVEDCYILGESPRGSGFGRGVLNAAWQFLVIPPRINGKPMVGTWVSIRIDYTQSGGFSPS